MLSRWGNSYIKVSRRRFLRTCSDFFQTLKWPKIPEDSSDFDYFWTECSDFDDFWTEFIVMTRSIIWDTLCFCKFFRFGRSSASRRMVVGRPSDGRRTSWRPFRADRRPFFFPTGDSKGGEYPPRKCDCLRALTKQRFLMMLGLGTCLPATATPQEIFCYTH